MNFAFVRSQGMVARRLAENRRGAAVGKTERWCLAFLGHALQRQV